MDKKMALAIRELLKKGYNKNDIYELLYIAYNFGDYDMLPKDKAIKANIEKTLSSDYEDAIKVLKK